MRVQNEGTGKSSWWVINPDAKTGKAARRRAASMETKAYEKRKGRVKKTIEARRSAQQLGTSLTGVNTLDQTPSPCSSLGEGLDVYPDSPLMHQIHTLSGPRTQSSYGMHNRSPNNNNRLSGNGSNNGSGYGLNGGLCENGNGSSGGGLQQQTSVGSIGSCSSITTEQQSTSNLTQLTAFRPRASSNASSSSRLSPPLNAALDDPLSPINSWSTNGPTELQPIFTSTSTGSAAAEMDPFTTEQLVDSMANTMTLSNGQPATTTIQQQALSSVRQQQGQQSQTIAQISPVSQQQQPQQVYMNGSAQQPQLLNGCYTPAGQPSLYQQHADTKVQQLVGQHAGVNCCSISCHDDENNNRSGYALSVEHLNHAGNNAAAAVCGGGGGGGGVGGGLIGLSQTVTNQNGHLVELLKGTSHLMPLQSPSSNDFAFKRARGTFLFIYFVYFVCLQNSDFTNKQTNLIFLLLKYSLHICWYNDGMWRISITGNESAYSHE